MLVRLQIDRMEPFANAQTFGSTGSYVRLMGTAYGELDPAHPQNAFIVNLAHAPRNARGRVEYAADVYIMRPTEVSRGNRKMLFEVTNRGRKMLLPVLHDAPETSPGAINDPTTPADAGNGLTFQQGYTLVWSGWDPDAPRQHHGMGLQAPVATDEGRPIVQTIRDEFVFGTRLPATRLTAPLSYTAATLDQAQARLTVRQREADTPRELDRSQWAYVDARTIALVPEGTAFQPGAIYDFWYPARHPTVLGIGFAATRDLVAFLRYETHDSARNLNPIALSDTATGIRAVLAFGNSQSGRYLRTHTELGCNQDEARRKVFDGVLTHVSGSGKVFTNFAFGQSYRTSTQHEDHTFPESWFPFAHTPTTDPLTGQTGALLRGDGFDPLIMEVNTSTEYWQKGASLLHLEPSGQYDLDIPPTVRLYLVAGTQHGGRAGMTAVRGNGLYPRNPHSPTPALRALLIALDRWVSEGIQPPPSQIPRRTHNTLVSPEGWAFPRLPGVTVPRQANPIAQYEEWIYPRPRPERPYVPWVPQVDADGNELAGIRLPPIAVPIATYTGWNLYAAPYPEGELCDREGSYFPLARTRRERMAAGDPRPSLEERYGNAAGYLQQVRAVVKALVAARLLLPEDAQAYEAQASQEAPRLLATAALR